jgi:hypothetical protein
VEVYKESRAANGLLSASGGARGSTPCLNTMPSAPMPAFHWPVTDDGRSAYER